MRRIFVEVTNGLNNWGKFMVGQFDDEEWNYMSVVGGQPLLRGRGMSRRDLLVVDIETGEGAIFSPWGDAEADLNKRLIWVCPMFLPFLRWLYLQPDPMKIPAHVDFPLELGDWAGYRREGPPVVFLTRDGLPLCSRHLVRAFDKMRPPYVDRDGWGVMVIDPIEARARELVCAMCGQLESPGRACEECSTPFDPQWPSVYCSNECALADGPDQMDRPRKRT